MESFFNGLDPEYSVVLPSEEEIIDVRHFAKTHIAFCRGNPGNKLFLPYYDRLVVAYKICK